MDPKCRLAGRGIWDETGPSQGGGGGKEAGSGQGPEDASRPLACGAEAGTSQPLNQESDRSAVFLFEEPASEVPEVVGHHGKRKVEFTKGLKHRRSV